MFKQFRAFLTSPRTRQLLLWCVPALAIGLGLRIWLTVEMPYGHFHDDTLDFLTTPDELLNHHKFELHEKKTFLAPILFTLPFLLPLPVLITVPIAQHLLGLALLILIGALCRHWFPAWRWFIIPVTVLVAIDPAILWYEHTLMAETVYLFTTALLAYAGTIYALAPTRGRYAFLLGALFLEAGARPEGKLLFGFGLLLLILIHARTWRVAGRRCAGLVLLAIITNLLTQTQQAGLLLYTSVVRFTPVQLKCAPGFESYIGPIRADLQQRWAVLPTFPRVRERRLVADAVRRYLSAQQPGHALGHSAINNFCLRLAKETCLRNAAAMPLYALAKFRAVSDETPSGQLGELRLYRKQIKAFTDSPRAYRLSQALTGQQIDDPATAAAFFHTHYRAVDWFNAWQQTWQRALAHFTIPPARNRGSFDDDESDAFALTTPLYFFLAAFGVCAIMLRRGPLQPFHLAWGLALAGLFFTIMLTANVKPRFRFVFEPYWFLYLALLVNSAGLAARKLLRRRNAHE